MTMVIEQVPERDVPAYAKDPSRPARSAVAEYFEANGFGPTGGYDDAWVDFKLGPVPCPFPNTNARRRALPYHDLHHVLTGYRTDLVGEFEISGWEIGAGCRDYLIPWQLNLGGMAGGVFLAPRKTFRAFVWGRRCRSLYGEPLEGLLSSTLGELRARFLHPDRAPRATVADALLFSVAVLAGLVIGAISFAMALPLAPVGIAIGWLRERRARRGRRPLPA